MLDLCLTNRALDVPSTAIYSRGDGVVPWRACQDGQGPRHESIEVTGTHCGIGHNRAMLAIVAERLGSPEMPWSPLRTPALIPRLPR